MEISDIPVTDPLGRVIGKAKLETDEYGVIAKIRLNEGYGKELFEVGKCGYFSELSFGPVFRPATPARDDSDTLAQGSFREAMKDVTIVDAVSAYPDLTLDNYPSSERILGMIKSIGDTFQRDIEAQLEFPPEQN